MRWYDNLPLLSYLLLRGRCRQCRARFSSRYFFIELGTGLNTRFERTDNGTAQWIELDLPDTIELRRRFFADTERRQMLAASLLDEDWLPVVEQRPGPCFFVADGVLAYLREDDVTSMLARIAGRFPGAMIAFDTVTRASMGQELAMAAKRSIAPYRWNARRSFANTPSSVRRFSGVRVAFNCSSSSRRDR